MNHAEGGEKPASVQDVDRLRNEMREEMGDIRTLMGQMAHALTRLTLLEERHSTVSAMQTKTLDAIEKLREEHMAMRLEQARAGDIDARVRAIEAATKESTLEYGRDKASFLASLRTVRIMTGITWAIFSALVGAGFLVWGK